MSTIPICLSIAGSDPCAGAGIQLDSRVFAFFGCYPCSIPASITVQNSKGLVESVALETRLVEKQLNTLLEDLRPAAVKIGAIGALSTLDSVLSILRAHQLPVVVDPVLASSNGVSLLSGSAAEISSTLRDSVSLLTPNIPEAEFLLETSITDRKGAQNAAMQLAKDLNTKVLLKGGHLQETQSIDILANGEEYTIFAKELVAIPRAVHGTGCALSAAIVAQVALGKSLHEAVEVASRWLSERLHHSQRLGGGSNLLLF